jgi:hypothetical protein
MLFASHNGGLGIPVNEMQRSINGGFGYGQAPGGGQIVPYDHWQPFDPGMITRGFGDQASEARLQELLTAEREKNRRLSTVFGIVTMLNVATTAVIIVGWMRGRKFERRTRKQGR